MGLPLIGTIADFAKAVLERVVPDPKQKADALLELAKLEQSGDLAAMAQQVEINKLDAVSSDKFQSRARPFIMWVCGGALALQLIVGPLISYGSALAGRPLTPPVMETELLTTMLIGMLGLGGMRTVEKLNKVA